MIHCLRSLYHSIRYSVTSLCDGRLHPFFARPVPLAIGGHEKRDGRLDQRHFTGVKPTAVPVIRAVRSPTYNRYQFQTESVTATYEGWPRQITFEYRDPWKWILALIQDDSLAPWHMWNAVKKFYCCGDHEERIYDEPNTGDVWWEVDVSCFKCYSSPY